MKLLTLDIAGTEVKGNVTDSDAFFFASLYHNTEEAELAKVGKELEAFNSVSDRLASEAIKRQEEKKLNYEEATKELEIELGLKIRRDIEHNLQTRKNVAWRIREIFPHLPQELVYFRGDFDFGIRLDMQDLVKILSGVMGIIFEQYMVEESSSASISSKAIADTNENISDSQENHSVTNIEQENIQLKQEIAKLKAAQQ